MTGIQTTCHIDTSNLMRASAILMRHSSRSPARCVNSTAYHVVKDVIEADGGFPVVTQERINTDMQVVTSPLVLQSGKPSQSKSKQNATMTFLGDTASSTPETNMAMRIVLARMHPSSQFNRLTGGRWALTPPEMSAAK